MKKIITNAPCASYKNTSSVAKKTAEDISKFTQKKEQQLTHVEFYHSGSEIIIHRVSSGNRLGSTGM